MDFNFNRMWSGFSKSAEKELEKAEEKKKHVASLSPVDNEDAVVVDIRNVFGLTGYGSGMGAYDSSTEMDENASINAYRELAMRPEVSMAVNEIVNEAVISDFTSSPVSLVFDDLTPTAKEPPIAEATKKRIIEEFEGILNLLRFKETAGERFRQWYIDGKCYYHAVLDPENAKNGIVDIRQIDPRHIKKVIETEEVNKNGVTLKRVKDTYYRYTSYITSKNNNTWENATKNEVVKIHPDSIAYANSGIFREKLNGEMLAISHLEKAIKPANQLKLLEDATVIYRIARAPERRIFNVDVSSLPKIKAEQYIASLMTKYRNKMVYNSNSGTVADQRNLMSMLEDFWLPKREGRGTDITTLPGGQGLGSLDDVDYFRKKLYNSLNVPTSRLNGEQPFALGRAGEITREEIKFAKFIISLRQRFSKFLLKLLEIQLVQKNILTPIEYREFEGLISFKWAEDMHWKELADAEILNGRLQTLQTIEQFVGKYYDAEWVMKNVLKFDEEQVQLALKHQQENRIDPNENDGEKPDNDDNEENEPKHNPPPPNLNKNQNNNDDDSLEKESDNDQQ